MTEMAMAWAAGLITLVAAIGVFAVLAALCWAAALEL